MSEFMQSPGWEVISITVLLLILSGFVHFWMTKFGKTTWMKTIGVLLTFTLYWIFFGLEHPLILLLVALLTGSQTMNSSASRNI
ncbi:MAG TPA: hypothetical protein EYQ69_07925 [Gemmatimonadetes bacterium]|jgi:hypothetical protein|nr:hypothetical protein [Gemmatimonadota bacterium]